MNKQFDLDYLGKDLTGNAEIQTAVDRGLAFMKLEKWEKALQVFDDLIDLHPESPCGWFGKARLASQNFTFFGLAMAEARPIIATAAENLEAAIKVVEAERKDEYIRLQATYSDNLKKNLVNVYVEKFNGFVDSLQKTAELVKYAVPQDCTQQDYVIYTICKAFDEVFNMEEDTIYKIPVEIISEVGNEYPSIIFASLHIVLMNEVMKPYYDAQRKRNVAVQKREARAEMRRDWNFRQGWGRSLDKSDIKMLDQYFPVYDLSHYFKFAIGDGWSLAKLIKDNSVFSDTAKWDDKVQEVFRAYLKLLKIINMPTLYIPIGDLQSAGVPHIYLQEIENDIQTGEEKRQEEVKVVSEQMKEKETKAKEQAAAAEAERKSTKWKLVIVCLLFGGFGIHNFMMGEKKKGVIKLLLCWTGISAIIALVDLFKLLTDSYEISR